MFFVCVSPYDIVTKGWFIKVEINYKEYMDNKTEIQGCQPKEHWIFEKKFMMEVKQILYIFN